MRSLILPVLAAAALGSAAPALAETGPSVVVSYEDLNLATPEGREALEARIAVAVDTVCGRPSPNNVTEGSAWSECRELTTAKAESDMNRVIAALDTVQVATAD